MKNVLLIIPRYLTYGMEGHYVMPMGILYVSAYLKYSKCCNVHTVNLNHRYGEEEDILRDIIEREGIDIVGFGGLSGEYRDLSRMAQLCRKIKPGLIIMLGGGIVTSDAEPAMMAMPEVDFGMIGEGEETIVELVTAIDLGGDVRLCQRHNISQRRIADYHGQTPRN